MSTIILRMAARVIVPFSLVFALFIYFKGHQVPGGGFVAGLVTSVGLVVLRMAEGPDALRRFLPVSEGPIIATGLTLALGTGLGAVLLGLPFFTSDHGYIHLPQTANTLPLEWATVMAFDLGVMLVVAGVVIGMIDALTRELEPGGGHEAEETS